MLQFETPSCFAGQPKPVMSWQTGPAGAQPLPLMSTTSGLPLALPQGSTRPSRTISLSKPQQPWIDVTLLLSSDGQDLLFQPPVPDFVRHFDNVLRDLPHTIAVVQRLVTHPELEVCQPDHTSPICICTAWNVQKCWCKVWILVAAEKHCTPAAFMQYLQAM